MTSPLDLPLKATMFECVSNPRGKPITLSLREFERMVRDTRAKRKDLLPLISFFRFRDNHRSNANALRFSAITLDYDGESVPLKEGAEKFRAAGLSALLHETASSKRDAPRWRAILPVSEPLPVASYAAMVARANGLLGGILAPESFTPAQQYFVGHVRERGACPITLT